MDALVTLSYSGGPLFPDEERYRLHRVWGNVPELAVWDERSWS